MARLLSFLSEPGTASANRAASTLVSRNVTVAGHRTSIRLEPAMWVALHEICERERAALNEIVTAVGTHRSESSLTAAIRVSVLNYFQAAVTEDGHRSAGHGLLPNLRPAPVSPCEPALPAPEPAYAHSPV